MWLANQQLKFLGLQISYQYHMLLGYSYQFSNKFKLDKSAAFGCFFIATLHGAPWWNLMFETSLGCK